MVVLDRVFKIDLSNINQIRAILYQNVYSEEHNIELFKDIIRRYIDIIGGVNFDPYTYTFTIKIRKSFIERISGHQSDCYYGVVAAIMGEFLSCLKTDLIPALSQVYMDPVSMYRDIVTETIYPLSNLCHVICIGESVLQIRL